MPEEAASGPEPSSRQRARWRLAPWGAMFLLREPRCAVWDLLWSSVALVAMAARGGAVETHAEPPPMMDDDGNSTDGCDHAEHAQAACGTSEVARPFLTVSANSFDHSEIVGVPSFASLSHEENALIAEVEVHVCAALRHLSRVAASDDQVAVDVDCEAEPSTQSGGVSSRWQAFATCRQSMMEAAWVFFLHANLNKSVLSGDIQVAAGWAIRFLGVGGPWTLRRLQELVVVAFEVLLDFFTAERTSAAGAEHRGLPPEIDARMIFLRDSCVAYLSAPIIPRFQTRLRRCVAGLREAGFFAPRGAESASLDGVIAHLLGEGDANVEVQQKFDGSGKGLELFREKDALHSAFCKAFTHASEQHLDGSCVLDVRQNVLHGANTVSILRSGDPWSKEDRANFLRTVGCVPEAERASRKEISGGSLSSLSALEVDEDDIKGLSIVGPEDVRLGWECDLKNGGLGLAKLIAGMDGCGGFCSAQRLGDPMRQGQPKARE